MPKGNPNIKNYSPIVDNTEIDKTENALLVSMALDVFNTPEPDLDKPDEVAKTIDRYFNSCISKGLRPGNLGLYTSLGLTKNNVRDLVQGRVKTVEGKHVSSSTISHIKKAIKVLSLYRESLGSEGKLNPATLIFWQKNFDGLEDVQRMEVTANNAPEADKTAEEIAAQIEQDIPVDAEYNEV